LALGLGDTLGEDLGVLVGSILGLLGVAALECDAVTLVLEALWGNKTLDLRCLGVWLLAFALWLDLTTDDELSDIIFLAEAEELADLRSTLGTKTLSCNSIGDTWDSGITLLDDAEGEDGEVHCDDASTDGFTLAFTGTTWAVAGVAIGKEEADTGWVHDSLLHWETLLVVATSDFEDVALEFITDRITWDFCAHALLHEDSQLTLIFDFNELLRSIRGV